MRLVNLEILGHPINIIVVILVIVLFWFGLYFVNHKAGNVMPTNEGN